MRVSQANGPLQVKAVAGTYVVLMALDIELDARAGLRGFAIKRGVRGQPQDWLRGIKYFKDLVANPKTGDDYSSRDEPFQTFLWSDYRATPGTTYDFTIIALYGDLHAFEERYSVAFSITTETADDGAHGVWFNRGTIASHAFETEFHNKALTDDMVNNVSEAGELLDPEAKWLSRGLAEACLKVINSAGHGEGLRVSAYEFTYQPVLTALKRALDRGVDVKIVFHDTKKPKDANRAAIAQAKLPQKILFPRTRVPIPHNKFIVKLSRGQPVQVWTGSTNFTDSGFLGQTNVGHLVTNAAVAKTYLDYWTELSSDPPHSVALQNAIALTPNPANVIHPSSTEPFYSPRKADNMLDWYGERITDTASLAMMTIPFNVADTILTALGKTSDAMRLVILEDPPTPAVKAAEQRNRGKLLFSNGAIMGKTFEKHKGPVGGATETRITNSGLDKWFVEEELARPSNKGHVFFVHAKVLVIDPLSDDPLICIGSANFSKNSLISNDENMLLIRGGTRVADIYMTELDRIFRHFHARDVINAKAEQGDNTPWLLLDATDQWITDAYKEGSFQNNRHLLFFPLANRPGWAVKAAKDGDPFLDEDKRAAQMRADKNTKARQRRAGGAVAKGGAKKGAAKGGGAKKGAAKKKIAKKAPAKRKAAKAPVKKAAARKKTVKKVAKAKGRSSKKR